MYQRGNQRILLISQILSKKRKFEDTCTKGVSVLLTRFSERILLISQILSKKRKFEDTCTKGVFLVNITDIK